MQSNILPVLFRINIFHDGFKDESQKGMLSMSIQFRPFKLVQNFVNIIELSPASTGTLLYTEQKCYVYVYYAFGLQTGLVCSNGGRNIVFYITTYVNLLLHFSVHIKHY